MELRHLINSIVRYTILIIVGLFMLYPLVWLFGASFKTNAEIYSSVSFFPPRLNLDAYIKGWKTATEYTFFTYFMNTFKIVVPRVVFTIISSVITAYGFARMKFFGKKILFSILIATLLLPKVVLYVPQFLLFKQFGWYDTFLPLIVPTIFAGDTFFVFMLIQFIRGIPRDLEEAAWIDGCNVLQSLYHVILPVLKPAIISVALFQFMWSMNDFIGPLIYISSVDKYPIALALRMSIDSSSVVHWNQVISMSLLSLAPSLLLFFSVQKYFVEGITAGSLKG